MYLASCHLLIILSRMAVFAGPGAHCGEGEEGGAVGSLGAVLDEDVLRVRGLLQARPHAGASQKRKDRSGMSFLNTCCLWLQGVGTPCVGEVLNKCVLLTRPQPQAREGMMKPLPFPLPSGDSEGWRGLPQGTECECWQHWQAAKVSTSAPCLLPETMAPQSCSCGDSVHLPPGSATVSAFSFLIAMAPTPWSAVCSKLASVFSSTESHTELTGRCGFSAQEPGHLFPAYALVSAVCFSCLPLVPQV